MGGRQLRLNIRCCAGALLVGFILAGCAAAPVRYQSATTPGSGYLDKLTHPAGVYHQVERGQTLWRIAREYDVPLEKISQANKLQDLTQLKTGQTLFIPGARSPKEVSPSVDRAKFRNFRSERDFIWPTVNGTVGIHFGQDKGYVKNKGMDIVAPHGAPVFAVKSGVVSYLDSSFRGLGKVIILDHQDKFLSIYAHLDSLAIKEGDLVKQGQAIGAVGKSGDVPAPVLHFELRKNGKAVNPIEYLQDV